MNYYFCGIYKCIASAIPVYSIILYIGLESVKQNRSLLRVQNSVTYIVLIIHCPGCTVLVHFYYFFNDANAELYVTILSIYSGYY